VGKNKPTVDNKVNVGISKFLTDSNIYINVYLTWIQQHGKDIARHDQCIGRTSMSNSLVLLWADLVVCGHLSKSLRRSLVSLQLSAQIKKWSEWSYLIYTSSPSVLQPILNHTVEVVSNFTISLMAAENSVLVFPGSWCWITLEDHTSVDKRRWKEHVCPGETRDRTAPLRSPHSQLHCASPPALSKRGEELVNAQTLPSLILAIKDTEAPDPTPFKEKIIHNSEYDI